MSATFRQKLSRAYRRHGSRDASENEARQAMAFYNQNSEHASYRANAMVALGNVLSRKGNSNTEAENLLKEAITILAANEGDAHEDTLLALSSYGYLLFRQKRYTEAADVYQRFLRSGANIYGQGHQRMLSAQKNLADCMYYQGELDLAEKGLQKILYLRQLIFPHKQDSLSISLYSLGRVYAKKNLKETARHYYFDAWQRSLELGASRSLVVIAIQLSNLLKGLKEHRSATDVLIDTFNVLRQGGMKDTYTAMVLKEALEHLVLSHRIGEVTELYKQTQDLEWEEAAGEQLSAMTILNGLALIELADRDSAQQILCDLEDSLELGDRENMEGISELRTQLGSIQK